jgi:hypothetical protein
VAADVGLVGLVLCAEVPGQRLGSRWARGAGGAAPTRVGVGAVRVVPIDLDETDRVAGGERVAVAGQRVGGEAEVGQRAVVAVALEELAELGAELAGAHVDRARQRVGALAAVAEPVDLLEIARPVGGSG